MEKHWQKWCRLCAREDEIHNIDVFNSNENGLTGNSLSTAIGKYFWVNMTPDDQISKVICIECHSLVSSLVLFTERVNKVQAMFTVLQNTKIANSVDPSELRIQYGLLQEDQAIVIKPQCNEIEQITKHTQNDIEAEVIEEDVFAEDLDCEIEALDQLPDEESENIEFHIPDAEKNLNVQFESNKGIQRREQKEKEEQQQDKSFDDSAEENEYISDVDLLDEEDGDEHVKNMEEEKEKKLSTELEESEIMREFKEEFIDNSSIDDSENNDSKDLMEEIISQGSLDEVFTQRTHRSRRMDSESDAKSNKQHYECNFCPKKYKNPTSYRKHMLEVHETKAKIPEFICEHCEKVCPTENQLNAHIRTHLTLEQKLDIPCPMCDRKFTKPAVMRQHVRGFHHNEKPYTCDECGRQLKTLAALHEHKLVHTSETPFECETCHKRFKNKARLKMHAETHSTIALICTECGLQLNTRRTLKMHMLVHSEEKKFKCDFCDAIFKRSKALKNHLILHTGLRPYACPFCPKTFTNGSNCRAHKKKTHRLELEEQEAKGIVTKTTRVPNLDDLRSCPSIVYNPRHYSKNVGGLSPRMRALLMAAEQKNYKLKQQEQQEREEEDEELQNGEEARSLKNDSENDSHEIIELHLEGMECEVDDVGEETVVYEIIDEM